MGKGGKDLWDDSAFLHALDDAISKYKEMHNIGGLDFPSEKENAISITETNLSALVSESHDSMRSTEADDNIILGSNTRTELEGTSSLPQVKENCNVDSCLSEPHTGSSNREVQEKQGVQEYNQLLNQYYELEEQRQKILVQLYEFGNCTSQDSGSGLQWNKSTSQELQPSAAQASYSTAVCPCYPYASQCWEPPCTSTASFFSGACVCKTCDTTSAVGVNGSSIEDDPIKGAVGAAENALSSLKTRSCGDTEVLLSGGEENDKQKANGIDETNVHHTLSSSTETDLTVVLNAWYCAGLYTGKYLTEQSLAKKRHG